MPRKKRGLPKVWIITGVLFFVITCVCLLGIVTAERISRTGKMQVDNRLIPSPVPAATSVYHKDVRVILNNPDSLNDKVELWLIFDDCNIDVVYNYVPNGTIATLTGKMCYGYAIPIGEANFYEVRFSSDIEKGLQRGDNFWVEEKYISIQNEF